MSWGRIIVQSASKSSLGIIITKAYNYRPMTDDQMHDLKDFLSVEIGRQINSELRTVIREEVSLQLEGQSEGIMKEFAELKTDVAELKTDVAELKTDVAELRSDVKYLKARADETDDKIEVIMTAVGEQFEDHEKRITNLERA